MQQVQAVVSLVLKQPVQQLLVQVVELVQTRQQVLPVQVLLEQKQLEQVQLVRRFGNQVYFGDVTRHQLLENAHAGSARGLALCIDDVEASLAVVRVLCWAVLGWTLPRSNARSAPFSNTTSCW